MKFRFITCLKNKQIVYIFNIFSTFIITFVENILFSSLLLLLKIFHNTTTELYLVNN